TLTAMLDFEKHLGDMWITAPPAGWQTPQLGTLEAKTVGIVGLGSIGTEVARRALAFGMHVVAVRRHERPAPLPGIELVPSLADLLPRADHLVVSVPATADTIDMFDAAAFAVLKPGAHIVNVA